MEYLLQGIGAAVAFFFLADIAVQIICFVAFLFRRDK